MVVVDNSDVLSVKIVDAAEVVEALDVRDETRDGDSFWKTL
jgi:hypothetical protein